MQEHEHQGLRLGSLGGTSLYLEPSFFVLAAIFVILDLRNGQTLPVALLWLPTLFLSVIIHELGHAAMIALLGFGRSVVALGSMGGITLNTRRARPWQDILISLAGPVTGFLFALLLAWWFIHSPFLQTDRMMSVWIPQMISANKVWAIFNLIPILPLDGGNVLRKLTLMMTTNIRSFKITVWCSMILCGLIVAASLLMHDSYLSIIAASLLFGNYQRWAAFRHSGFTD